MQVQGTHYRSIWLDDSQRVCIIDQTRLPHEFRTRVLHTLEDAVESIVNMRVRGAPLIGATAAWGVWLALREDPGDAGLDRAMTALLKSRPTAVNLRVVLDEVRSTLEPIPAPERETRARALAQALCERDVRTNRDIGRHGLELLSALARTRPHPLNILTHCNAGWLATVDWGTVTAPLFMARDRGLDIHVWVDETRPRMQGALTAWELAQAGIPHTYVTDNAGGHLMQEGRVDVCLVGSDRTTAGGDVANKIGTYLKALAARDNDIPFYVALPSSTIDWTLHEGVGVIPIEERPGEEVELVQGRDSKDLLAQVRVTPPGTPVANPAFDVTPARLITGLITERGVVKPDRDALAQLFPEPAARHADLRRRA